MIWSDFKKSSCKNWPFLSLFGLKLYRIWQWDTESSWQPAAAKTSCHSSESSWKYFTMTIDPSPSFAPYCTSPLNNFWCAETRVFGIPGVDRKIVGLFLLTLHHHVPGGRTDRQLGQHLWRRSKPWQLAMFGEHCGVVQYQSCDKRSCGWRAPF